MGARIASAYELPSRGAHKLALLSTPGPAGRKKNVRQS